MKHNMFIQHWEGNDGACLCEMAPFWPNMLEQCCANVVIYLWNGCTGIRTTFNYDIYFSYMLHITMK